MIDIENWSKQPHSPSYYLRGRGLYYNNCSVPFAYLIDTVDGPVVVANTRELPDSIINILAKYRIFHVTEIVLEKLMKYFSHTNHELATKHHEFSPNVDMVTVGRTALAIVDDLNKIRCPLPPRLAEINDIRHDLPTMVSGRVCGVVSIREAFGFPNFEYMAIIPSDTDHTFNGSAIAIGRGEMIAHLLNDVRDATELKLKDAFVYKFRK